MATALIFRSHPNSAWRRPQSFARIRTPHGDGLNRSLAGKLRMATASTNHSHPGST
ncbi:MAG: hypothetical protein LBD21_11545 [Tannerellaceae bacterium]|nr:hypothetical protein [Tannerellaceae bacterium]